MKDNTAKILGLEDVIVKNVWSDEKYRHIEIELPRRAHKCPCCRVMTERIHDYREQKIKDIGAFGTEVCLHLRKRRYVCGKCGKRFYEQNSFLPRYYRMTNRKVARIIEDFRSLTSASEIARKNDVSATTAFRCFNVVNYKRKALPEVLSIDEFKGNAGGEKYQTILTDAKNKNVVDILPSRKKAQLIRYFKKSKDRSNVKYVVMDMNAQFKDVAETCFPKATIVIDRYHVTRQAIWALENVRKAEQKKLPEAWRKYCKHSKTLLLKPKEKLTEEEKDRVRIILGLSTRLEIAYDLKNDFLDFMHSPNSETAKKALAEWLYHAENAGLPELRACTTAMHNWSEYILNAFDCPYSNGFTEGCNNKTKVLKRVCFGVRDFRRFRNRILHCAARA